MGRRSSVVISLIATLGLVAAGCASTGGGSKSASGRRFDFFGPAVANDDQTDPWYPKVVEWQGRMQQEGTRLPGSDRSLRGAIQSGKLTQAMGAYRDQKRVEIAKSVADWAQHVARRYYKWDPGNDKPEWDHWPTVGELLANNGDDCDGLDLIAYQMLREFGFPADRVYRGIIRRDRDKANHMVTLWFEDPKDPWVLDATGAVTFEMRRFSQLEGWTPTKIFNERGQFLAIEGKHSSSVARGE
jgi:predicted transglutaminase-like cysteine proteinase